jgi:4-hydroxyphenylacetate 3-hydroxylase, reductase component
MTRAFRDALGCFATGVTVVTTATPAGQKIGLTVNSFSSVSLTPPLILWCLSRDSGLVKHFRKGTPFAVNFLAKGQRDLAVHFSRPGQNRFDGIASRKGGNGAPLLPGTAGGLECTTERVFEGGDHVIILGRVHRHTSGKAPPLVFHRGRFHAF